MFTFQTIANIVTGELLQSKSNTEVHHLLLDSRKIYSPETSLFFAISGERHDGHRYIADLYQRGVRQFIIERMIDLSSFPLANIIFVSSSVAALQSIATKHRAQFQYPVIGITGSNGKTIVKEWLSQLLAKDFRIVRSPRSYNSQVGVPLSVWEMQDQHTLGVFEAGISKRGEMLNLQNIIQPTIGIFTNIGSSHSEGFIDDNQKIQEKLLLFDKAETLIYCQDYKNIEIEIKKQERNYKIFSWSKENILADVYISDLKTQVQTTVVNFKYKNTSHVVLLPFTDEASIENAIHCLSFLLYFNIEIEEIQERLLLLHPVAMRLELKQGINACYLIDDSYNNDLAGLVIAINFLEQQKQTEKKCLILSDMLESALAPEQLYTQVATLINAKNIQHFIGIGKTICQYHNYFKGGEFFQTTEDFLNADSIKNFAIQTILIKGARTFRFEKIVSALQQKVHGTILEINLDALSHNLNYFKSLLLPQTKIMVMVKAFAYGSGSYEVANLLQFHRVDYLGVAYADEGIDLRAHGIGLPIMVMNPTAESFWKMHASHLEPEIYSFKIFNQYLNFIDREKIGRTKIHLKLDTGMHRLGFEMEDMHLLIDLLQKNPNIIIASIFSHLVGADESIHNEFSIQQIQLFETMAFQIESAIGYSAIKHILNSAGIVRFALHQFDMVRLGIGLYGVDATSLKQSNLLSVGTLKTIISQIKTVTVGETIGYSRKFIATAPLKIGTIAIGYADGYDRGFSQGIGKVFIKGKLCPILGNVCMDMSMVDISSTEAQEGDEVEIFGKNVSIIDMANDIQTIPYEILTNVSDRVKRVFYSEL